MNHLEDLGADGIKLQVPLKRRDSGLY